MIWNEQLDTFIVVILLSFFIGCLFDLHSSKVLQMNTPKIAYFFALNTFVFVCLYGLTPNAYQCIFICNLLVVAGLFDFMTHEIPDSIHFLILMAGLILFQPFSAFLGFMIVPLPFLVAAIKTGKIGGGDVKLMAASGFALGLSCGVWMMIWGLLACLLWHSVFCKEQKSLPLAPFLAFGAFLAMFPV